VYAALWLVFGYRQHPLEVDARRAEANSSAVAHE